MLGGNFPSNANVWWKIDHDTRDLTIGLHNKDLCNVVTEYNHFADGDVVAGYEQYMTPWAKIGATIASFKVDTKNGKVAPTTLEGWFDEDYVFRNGGIAGSLGNPAWNANNRLDEWQRYISSEWINLDWESTANGYKPLTATTKSTPSTIIGRIGPIRSIRSGTRTSTIAMAIGIRATSLRRSSRPYTSKLARPTTCLSIT